MPRPSIKIRVTLPCSHVLQIKWIKQEEGLNSEDITNAAAVLRYWVDNRASRHKCELVSPQNPMGIEGYKSNLEKKREAKKDALP